MPRTEGSQKNSMGGPLGDYGSYPGKRRLYRQLLQLGYYWPTMKREFEELVKT